MQGSDSNKVSEERSEALAGMSLERTMIFTQIAVRLPNARRLSGISHGDATAIILDKWSITN